MQHQLDVEENTKPQTNSEIIKEAIYSNPLVLLSITDLALIDEINSYLPFTTGFEIECNRGLLYNTENFTNIPDIMFVQNDSCEQRYQIPRGLTGLVCLYNICEQLKLNSELNFGSGVHYHIDLTDCFSKITDKHIKDNSDWILEELDTWNYQGDYNSRQCSRARCWVKYSDEHRTMEIRVGEMSFDYELLVKRIIHANYIVKKLKHNLGFPTSKEVSMIFNIAQIKEYFSNHSSSVNQEVLLLQKQLKILTTVQQKIEVNANAIIKSRVIKIV